MMLPVEVLAVDGVACPLHAVLLDARLLPAYTSALSLLLLLGRPLFRANKPDVKPLAAEEGRKSITERVNDFVKARGGWVVYAFNITRVLGTSALVGLTIVAVVLSSGQRKEEISGSTQILLGGGRRWDGMWDCTGRAEVGLLVAYVYATTLSLAAILLPGRIRATCSFHASVLLFLQFLVFVWRNLLPLTTYAGIPADGTLPWLTWTRGAFLTLVGLLLPAFVPRVYVPYDPSHPASTPAPEQTASIFNFLFFVFLEPLVLKAWRLPSLPYEMLPPLPDTDWSDNLRLRTMDALDPIRRRELGKKDRHLFFGLTEIFYKDWINMALSLMMQVLVGFMGPIGVNRLLTYMENGGEGAIVRPWVWIAFIFLAPMLNSIALNLYSFTATRMAVQAESILTQLIFEHALRVRLTDETPIASSAVTSTETESTGPSNEAVAAAAALARTEGSTGTEAETLAEVETLVADSDPAAIDSSANESSKDKKDDQPATATTTALHLSGKLNNLFGTDIANCLGGKDFLVMVVNCPFEAVVCACFLWMILDWAAVVGMVFIIITLPVPMLIGSMMQGTQEKLMEAKDARVQTVTESIGIIRMIKMFAWEPLVKNKISEQRKQEVKYIRRNKILNIVNNEVTGMLPMITMIITYAFYTLVLGKPLDAARVFSSAPVFDTLRGDMLNMVMLLGGLVQAKVSLDRITNFLGSSLLLDRYRKTGTDEPDVAVQSPEENVVGFHNATFTWLDTTDQPSLPGHRNFRLHIDDLIFKSGEVNLIIGPTGCGKTSILLALLGEMHFVPEGVDSWYSLPRSRGVAYAAQESWVQNDTIRANILFGCPYDEARYKKVIYQCGLEPDIAMFAAGDETEVGERGLTLSGGQRARVTLARAVYSRARILLLDDVLSALDAHTTAWVVENCLQGDLISGRTVILVTHAAQAIRAPVAKNIISLNSRGEIISQGPVTSELVFDPSLKKELDQDKTALKEESEDHKGEQDQTADGKLVLEEEMTEGRIRLATAKLFTDAYGGPMFWVVLLAGYTIAICSDIGATWWLGHWAQAYEMRTGTVDVPYYLLLYIGIVCVQETAWFVMQSFYAVASARACAYVHEVLSKSVFGATLRWIDTTPVGRIMSRFTGNMSEFDGGLSSLVEIIVRTTISLVMRLVVILYVSPIYGFPSALILVLGFGLGQLYIHVQMSSRRLRSNYRSPLFSHLGAAVAGLVSVRAYGAEEAFKVELRKRADAYSRPSRTFYNLSKWVSTRTDFLRATFSAGLAAYLLYVRRDVGASTTGFSLAMAMEFSYSILEWVRYANMVELAANSLERIRDYLVVEHEPEPTESGKPPAYWPASGAIRVKNLSARYSKDGPLVLQGISFEIKSGERIGIVGRTGSGKTSLALALLRLIPTDGQVHFDNLLTTSINLDALRSNLAIIPQEPTLLSGTIRTNLDPYGQHDDAVLYAALKACGLIRSASSSTPSTSTSSSSAPVSTAGDRNKITLDTPVSHAGQNFSTGERQLIALARAILRGTKALILDEATASVDSETDSLIQGTIRRELGGATLLTVAHRLGTVVDYDRILVLDAGKVVEFDTPWNLLQNETSYFRSLVESSGDKDKLWSMAEKGRTD